MKPAVDDEALARIHSQHAHLCGIAVRPRLPVGVDTLRVLIEAAFWASMRTDEGRPTRTRVAIVPDGTVPTFPLHHPLELTEATIARLSHAVPPRGAIVVEADGESIHIVGIEPYAALDPMTGVVVEAYAPGIVRVGLGVFQPFVVFSGQDTMFTEAPRHTTLAAHLQRLLGEPVPNTDDELETQARWRECLALADLAREVVGGGHGGTLLVVPDERGDWLQSLDPYPFQLARADVSVPDAIRRELREAADHGEAIDRLYACSLSDDEKEAIRAGMSPTTWRPQDMSRIASLAAVDGAVIVGPDVRVFGFGAKIRVRHPGPVRVVMSPPLAGSAASSQSDLEALGGTRHQSAARFVSAHHEAIALIASQDRRLSLASWSDEHAAVLVLRDVQWWT